MRVQVSVVLCVQALVEVRGRAAVLLHVSTVHPPRSSALFSRQVTSCLVLLGFSLERASEAPRVTSGGGWFSRGSRFRFSGKCQREVYTDSAKIERKEPQFERFVLQPASAQLFYICGTLRLSDLCLSSQMYFQPKPSQPILPSQTIRVTTTQVQKPAAQPEYACTVNRAHFS